jgi:glutamate-1-semialdehyde 2,1-aminomutase
MERLAPLGPVYQAGTLSGNPVSMAAGIATLELLSAPGFHERLGKQTDTLIAGLRAAAARAGVALATNHVCGMFGFFFSEEPVVDAYAKVMASDVAHFNRFFHAMIAAGVYFAPSAFEAGFLSAAHTSADIDATVAAAERAFTA